MAGMGNQTSNQTRVQQDRRTAMEALKDALKREGRTQAWVAVRLTEAGLTMNRASLNSYLNGYRRVPRHLLVELCAIAHIPVERVTARIADTAQLIQASKRNTARD